MWEQAFLILVSIGGFIIVCLPGLGTGKIRTISNWIGIFTFSIPWFILPFTTQPKIPEMFGIVITSIGLAFFIFGLVFSMRASRKIFEVVGRAGHAEPSRLVTDGPYGFVRHPIYCGLFFAMLGWSLIWNGVYSILLMPILYFLFRIEAKLEEKQVEKKFGESYVTYRKKVPAFFPIILAVPLIIIAITIIVGIVLSQIPLS